jgi:dGTPase
VSAKISPPDAGLAPYAAAENRSGGRRYPEPQHGYRGEYQRDRDRIIHSTAFRRLVYKTQVFVNHEGDLYRTRLTHSLEVAQIARTVARSLELNEQLVEAICLAHDLGHTPFGHAGQDALNLCMRDFGGFEHNLQSLRVVDELEEKYASFPGLNLMFETREGILKHCSKKNAQTLGELGLRFTDRKQPGLEAQLANVADEIAYNHHDVDDGLRAGLLAVDELSEVALFREQYERVKATYPDITRRALVHETVRGMINAIVTNLLDTTRQRLADSRPENIDAVRDLDGPLVGLSEQTGSEHQQLKRFLQRGLYLHEKVQHMTRKAAAIVTALFETYMNDLAAMPAEHMNKAQLWEAESGTAGRARAVADYIAGMTDRYAVSAYQRLVDPADPL